MKRRLIVKVPGGVAVGGIVYQTDQAGLAGVGEVWVTEQCTL